MGDMSSAHTMAAMPAADPAHLTALVTGASAGIGEGLARCFARDGHRLVLVARNAGKLNALAMALRAEHGTRVDVLPADLAEPAAAAALAAALRRKRRTVDVLVNNAGVLEQGAFTDIDAARHQQLIALNVAGLTALLWAFLPGMVERGHGRVLNVASIASFQPVPGLASYAASKAYVLSLAESLAEELAEELAGSGVTVAALCPGITATGMLHGAAAKNTRLAQLPTVMVGDVAEVAEAGYRACLQGTVIVVPGVVNQATVLAAGNTAKWLLRKVTGMLGRKLI